MKLIQTKLRMKICVLILFEGRMGIKNQSRLYSSFNNIKTECVDVKNNNI